MLQIHLPDHQINYHIELFQKIDSWFRPEITFYGSVIITKAGSFKPLRVMASRCRG